MRLFWVRITWSLMVLWVLVACNSEPAPHPAIDSQNESEGRVLVLGDISDEAAETIQGTQPTADYIATRLSEFGITGATVKIAPDLETMIQWMADGVVDIYFDSPYPALVVSQETGAVPILRRLKYGVAEYHALFFTRADSGVTSLADLQGKKIAFEEPFSTSGYMLPYAYLIELGVNLVQKTGLESVVLPDEVGYVFSTADNTTIQWVVSGRVPVGVIDNISYELFIPKETRGELMVLAETEAVPRQLVLVRADTDAAMQEAIKQILLEMDETPEGQAVLETFLTTEFDEFPEGAEPALGRIRALVELAQGQ